MVNKEKTKNTDDEDDKVMINDEYQSIDYTIPKYPVQKFNYAVYLVKLFSTLNILTFNCK